MVRQLLLLSMLSSLAAAQEAAYRCQAPAEIWGLTVDQVRARLQRGQDNFFLQKQLLDLTPDSPKPGTLAPEFERRLRDHPDDGRFLYLYGVALTGKNTPEAIVNLQRAAWADPDLPWPYAALADIYDSPNFLNAEKRIANARTYHVLCPANTDSYRYLDKIEDLAEAAAWARDLRKLLERSVDPADVRYWPILWAAEFRASPRADYDALRTQVAADVKRLESSPQTGDRTQLNALLDGYKLTGRLDDVKRIEQELSADGGFGTTYQAWAKQAGLMGPKLLTEKERQAVSRDYARVSAGWVAMWPNSAAAWSVRLSAVGGNPDFDRQELERVGDQFLKVDAAQQGGWNYVPAKLHVAVHWVHYGIRLADSVRMAGEALDQILLGPEELNDLRATPAAAASLKAQQFGYDSSVWDAMCTIADGAVQLKDFDKAQSMVSRMQRWLAQNVSKKDDPTTGYYTFEARSLESAGKLAEAEGHKAEAVALYAKAIAAEPRYAEGGLAKRVRALWNEQGGTQEGWDIAIRRLPFPNAPQPVPAPLPIVAPPFDPWQKLYKPLPKATFTNSLGKPWSISNLRGKPAFVNVWATWCEPCRAELPQVQKLYEMSLQRGDFQVITFNVDDNPGVIEPFLKANGYTFPVIALTQAYVDGITQPPSNPQNWIVDQNATLRERSLGFDSTIADWAKAMAERVAPSSH